MHEPFYSLKVVSERTGLSAATLHAWEKRYGAVKPHRTSGGHRAYTADDLEKLCLLVELKDFGHPIGRIARLSMPQLARIVQDKRLKKTTSPSAKTPNGIGNRTAFCRRILLALDAYDLQRVNREINVARERFDSVTFVLEAIVPLFARIDAMVAKGQLTVPQEHAISFIVKAAAMQELARCGWGQDHPMQKPKPRTRRVVLATMEGDLHEIGVLLAAVLCAHQGLTVIYLGANVPAEPLGEAIRALRADILILSCPKVPWKSLPQPPAVFLQALTAALPRLCEIWIGGNDAVLLGRMVTSHKAISVKTLHDLQRELKRL